MRAVIIDAHSLSLYPETKEEECLLQEWYNKGVIHFDGGEWHGDNIYGLGVSFKNEEAEDAKIT